MLLSNKRGLTLLNCVLKILTKLYQIRLTLVLQDFISEEQMLSYLVGLFIGLYYSLMKSFRKHRYIRGHLV